MLSEIEPQHVAFARDRFGDVFPRLYPALFGLLYRLLGERFENEDVL